MAKKQMVVAEKNRIKQLLTFHIAGRLFGIEISAAREVSSEVEFTPVFHAAEEVKGLVNIRGQIYLVLDLHKILGYAPTEKTEDTRFIILKENVGESFGVIIDKVGEVVEISEREIRNIHSGNDNAIEELGSKVEALTLGISKLENQLLVVLNPEKLLTEFNKENKK